MKLERVSITLGVDVGHPEITLLGIYFQSKGIRIHSDVRSKSYWIPYFHHLSLPVLERFNLGRRYTYSEIIALLTKD